jgi:hypothetical protein
MEGNTVEENAKIIYLKTSLNRSLELIRLGIKKLENVKSINHEDYYFVFLYLSIGFEFLMKIIISFKMYKDNKFFPKKVELKEMRHDLEKLRKVIIKNYDKISGDIIEKYREIENDKKFISENHILIILIKLITDFALKDRYFELNYAIRKQRNGKTNGNKKEINNNKDSVARMNELVHSFIKKDHPSLADKMNFDDPNNLWEEANRLHIIPPLKKFIGALARQFVFGILGNEAVNCRSINTLKKYAYLKDYKVEDKDWTIK